MRPSSEAIRRARAPGAKKAPHSLAPHILRPRVARAQKIIRSIPSSIPGTHAQRECSSSFFYCVWSPIQLAQHIPLPVFVLPLSRESPDCPSLRASREHIFIARSVSKKDGLVAPYPCNLAS